MPEKRVAIFFGKDLMDRSDVQMKARKHATDALVREGCVVESVTFEEHRCVNGICELEEDLLLGPHAHIFGRGTTEEVVDA